MTLKARRILSTIFILLFLIITPAIILYAAGFKLSKNGFSIQKTGMFIINSNPKGAKLLINGQVQKNFVSSLFDKNSFIATPAKIQNLLPGEYDLALELDGYWGWQKKLTIRPGAATFAEDVYLFKKDLPIKILPAKIESIDFSPDKSQALILSAGQLTVFNLATEAKDSINQNNLKGKNAVWSEDGQQIVVGDYLYSLNDLNAKIDLSKLAPGAFNYKWLNNSLYFQDKTVIYRLNNANLPEKIISNKKFDNFLIKDRYLYLISKSGLMANLLEVIDLASGEQVKSISLPASANYSFINPNQTLVNLYDGVHKILYLVDPLADYSSPLVDIINNVKITSWLNGDDLLYAGDYEIWLYNLESKNKTLITRISQMINGVAIQPNKNYIIYATDRTISAIELDEREKRNSSELVNFDSINSFILDANNNLLYFSGRIGQTDGLYKLFIQ